jgi:hypothetical protein
VTLAEHAREAIDVQNACNISGVARSFVEAIDAIRASGNLSTETIAIHPIVTLFVSKLTSLNGHECLCGACVEHFCNALNACKTVIGEGPSAPLPK